MSTKEEKSAKPEAECAFCDFMHKSPCAAPFIDWEKCHEQCTDETADDNAAKKLSSTRCAATRARPSSLVWW